MEHNNNHTAPMVSVRDVSFTYGEDWVLENLSLDVYRGETLVILGGSGAGKSTLLRLIVGLSKPTRGEVSVFGENITHFSEKRLLPLRSRLGFVFQGGALFDSLTVAENVGYSLRENPRYKNLPFEKSVCEVLEYINLEHAYDTLPSNLSGGQRKRVAIARAIITRPEIILYDEPTAGLDPIVSKKINTLINQLRDERNITSIVVTHILTDAFAVANRLVMLKGGALVFEGRPEELMNSEDDYIQEFVS